MLAAVTVIFLKKTKNQFLDKINGSMSTKFQVCIVFRLARRRDTNKQTNIQVNLRISSAGCSPHVDFDRNYYHPYYLFVASLPPWRQTKVAFWSPYYCIAFSPFDNFWRKSYFTEVLNFSAQPVTYVLIKNEFVQKNR